MRMKQRIGILAGAMLGLVALASSSQAAEIVDDAKRLLAATPDLYRAPATGEPSTEDRAKDCRELERELGALMGQTYSYKPGFYEDPVHGTALWLGLTATVTPLVSYGLLGYSGYVEYQEGRRIQTAEERIALLRQLKAEQRCFEI